MEMSLIWETEARLGYTGAKARPESRGERGLGPGWPGDEKSGEAAATGPAQPGLAAAGLGQNWPSLLRKMKKNLGQHGLVCTHLTQGP